MQPLDLRVFGSLKENWINSVRSSQMKNIGDVVTKANFSGVFKQAWVKTCQPSLGISGFREAGLVPLDRGRVNCNKMNPAQVFSVPSGIHPIPPSPVLPTAIPAPPAPVSRLPTYVPVPPDSEPVLPTHVFVPPAYVSGLPTYVPVPPDSEPVLPTHVFVLPAPVSGLPTYIPVPPDSEPVLPTHVFVLPAPVSGLPTYIPVPPDSEPVLPTHVTVSPIPAPALPIHVPDTPTQKPVVTSDLQKPGQLDAAGTSIGDLLVAFPSTSGSNVSASFSKHLKTPQVLPKVSNSKKLRHQALPNLSLETNSEKYFWSVNDKRRRK